MWIIRGNLHAGYVLRGRHADICELGGQSLPSYEVLGGMAAIAVSRELDIELNLVRMSYAGEVLDARGDWQRLCEVGPQGAVLVRPDGIIASRVEAADDAGYKLRTALEHVLRGQLTEDAC